MPRRPNLRPHQLRIFCGCTAFGIPMIRIATWANGFFRHEGADFRCTNCGDGRRALLVPRFILPDRIRFRRI